MRDHLAWQRLAAEEPLDPEVAVCDSHHHLWDGPGDRGRYLLQEFSEDAGGGHKILKTVFVECGTMYREHGPEELRPAGEVDFAQDMADQANSGPWGPTAVAAAVVGFADLTLGSGVGRVLEAHIKAGKGRLRGIRQSCTWDEDASILSMAKGQGMTQGAKFREGFALLQEYGLSFDAWQYHTQLRQLAGLAGEFSDTTIIVNHTGGVLGIGPYAGKRQEVLKEWQRGMTELASRPNVVVKLGGLGMPRCGFGWHERAKPPSSTELAEAMGPYFRFCIDLFGAGRCMFESNFPVDKVSYSYTVLWNAFKRACEDRSPEERSALLYDTAARVYKL
jgi:L-fuconolactonase